MYDDGALSVAWRMQRYVQANCFYNCVKLNGDFLHRFHRFVRGGDRIVLHFCVYLNAYG